MQTILETRLAAARDGEGIRIGATHDTDDWEGSMDSYSIIHGLVFPLETVQFLLCVMRMRQKAK